MYAQDSIDLLTRSGSTSSDTRSTASTSLTLASCCIVLDDRIKWISFHSGYDFGYLLKILTCKPLPAEESDFFALMQLFFPCIYDIKFLMKSCRSLRGGLNDLAEDLDVDRYGPQHQAGSDSLLTAATFFKLREMFFENTIDDEKYRNVLYGLHRPRALIKK